MQVKIMSRNGDIIKTMEVKKGISIKSAHDESMIYYDAFKYSEIVINMSNVAHINVLK